MKTSFLTYKYRIKDSVAKKKLTELSWKVNNVWNYCNEISQFAMHRDRNFIDKYKMCGLTKGTSKEIGLPAHTIERVCIEHAIRRKQFGKSKLNWRSRKRSLGWIPFRSSSIKLNGNALKFNNRTYKLWLHRPVEGRIKSGNFVQDSRGRWYVCFNCEVEVPESSETQDRIGIDLGLKDIIVCSDETKYTRENITNKYEDELAMAQRAGKKKRVTAIHAKIKNVRKNWTHNVTSELSKKNKNFVVGDVSSSRLMKTKMSKSVSDASWYDLKTCLTYKANKLGRSVVVINEMFSTVTCSVCLKRTGPSGLSGLEVREWQCENCDTVHDRDVNAANNILRLVYQTPIKGDLLL